jgi:hypothetical protein
VTLIVIATPAASTTKSLSASASASAARGIGLRLGFVNLQGPAAEFLAIQGSHCLIRFGRIGHFNKSESARASGFPIGDNAHLFDGPVRLKQSAKLRLGCAVRQVAYVQIFHRSPSLSAGIAIANVG